MMMGPPIAADSHDTGASASGIAVTTGLFGYHPNSRRGKQVFFVQTLVLSFIPVGILLVQNGIAFHQVLADRAAVVRKDAAVSHCFHVLWVSALSRVLCYHPR